MRRLFSIVAIFLMLTAVAPVLACVTGSAMNSEEKACCRSMHGQCGEMAKMGCCRTAVKTDASPQIAASSPATDVHWICAALLAAPATSTLTLTPATLSQAPLEHSPPGLLTAKTTVLRV